MQNDFEKNIAQRMQEFSIAPQPEIWQQVKAALPPEKKRRFALWWWLLPLAILLGAGFWMISGKQPTGAKKESAAIPQSSSGKNEIAQKAPAIYPNDTASKNGLAATIKKVAVTKNSTPQPNPNDDTDPLAKTTNSVVGKQVVLSNNTSVNRPKRLSQPELKYADSGRQLATRSYSPRFEKRITNPYSNSNSNQLESILQNAIGNKALVKADTAFEVAKKDSVSTLPAGTIAAQQTADTAAKKGDTAVAVRPVANKLNTAGKQHRITWMAEAGLGLSWQQLSAINSGNYYSNLQLSTIPAVGQPIGNYAPLSSPKSGYSIRLGITRKQTITPHWRWELALRYQLLSTTQSYGSRRDSAASYYSATAARIYNPGDTLVYRNYIHQLQLAPRIAYTVNPAAHSPVSFFAGFSVGYVISSNQLLPDYRSYVYIRSSQNMVRWLYAAELGANVFIRQKIGVGFTYQVGLNNITKPALLSGFSWQALQVHIGIPLFNHFSK